MDYIGFRYITIKLRGLGIIAAYKKLKTSKLKKYYNKVSFIMTETFPIKKIVKLFPWKKLA